MYTFVTSFPKKHEEEYGLPMLESVIDKWKPTDFKLHVYLEGYKGETDGLPQASFITYRHIEDVEARNAFIKRNADKPFFLFLANYAVHTPIQARKDLTAKYEAKVRTKQKNAKR